MQRGLAIAASCVLLALAGYVLSLRMSNAALRADNASLSRSVNVLEDARAQALEARAVADAHRARLERDQAKAQGVIESLLTADLGVCADAPLDPAIIHLLDGLR